MLTDLEALEKGRGEEVLFLVGEEHDLEPHGLSGAVRHLARHHTLLLHHGVFESSLGYVT